MDPNQDQEKKDIQWVGETPRRQNRGTLPAEGYITYFGTSLLEERDWQRRQLVRELQRLDREIEASEGYRVRNRMGLLEKIYFVFDVNYLNLRGVLEEFELNLKRILDGFEQPMVFLRLWEEKNRDRFDPFLNDVTRLFHNYLAGAATLLDYVRASRGEVYRGTEFSEEYRTRWDQQFGDASLPQFVEELLDYMLREGLPLAAAELTFGRIGSRVEVNSAIELNASKLGEWEHWSEKGREHLNTLGNKVRLDRVVDEHAAVVADFYRWFVTRQTELYQGAIEELEELEGERERLRQEIRRLEGIAEIAEKPPLISSRGELNRAAVVARGEQPATAAQEEQDEQPAITAREGQDEATPAAREEGDESAVATREERNEPAVAAQEERDESATAAREEEEPATAAREGQDEPATAAEERDESATITRQEDRDRLAKELEAERRYREWDKERADRLESQLERELNKGFWRRTFGR